MNPTEDSLRHSYRTFQERLLASRLIHFAAGEMMWECSSTSACECGYLDDTRMMTSRLRYDLSRLKSLSSEDTARLWTELAFSYQNRSLTNDKDRLSALSGLAHRFKEQSPELGKYVAGLWSNYALSMIMFEVQTGIRVPRYVAPSWSWACIQGRFRRNDQVCNNDEFEAELDDIYCDLTSPDLYGAITSAHISITSPAIDAVITLEGHHGDAMLELTNDIKAFFVSDIPLTDGEIGSRVTCLFLRGVHSKPPNRYIEALVVKVAKSMKEYQRIGIAHLLSNNDNTRYETLPLQRTSITLI